MKDLLGSREKLLELVIEELEEIRDQYGDARRTEIVDADGDIAVEDMIAEEDMVVTVTHTATSSATRSAPTGRRSAAARA